MLSSQTMCCSGTISSSSSMARVVALIQARMGSSRFPGKMLAELGGIPVIEWVLRRASRARLLDDVVLATTDLSRDDVLAAVAKRVGLGVFRGSETDVLGRFAAASKEFRAEAIVRVCADNPFIDPAEIDRLIEHFHGHGGDYACNHQQRLGNRYADGFGAEIISARALRGLDETASDPRDREHVTRAVWLNEVRYGVSAVPAPPSLAFPELRFDVDVPADLEYLRSLVTMGVTRESSAAEIVRIAQAHEVPGAQQE